MIMSTPDKNKGPEKNNEPKKSVDLKWKFIKDFSKNSLSWKDKNIFLDDVMKKPSIESGSFLESEINKYQAKNSEFNDFDQKKITIYDLQRQVGKQYSSLEYSRASYLERSFSKYDLNLKQKEKLEDEIKWKSEVELNKLINLENENNKFINKIFGENKISKINSFKVFENISESDIKIRLSKLSETDKKSVWEALYNFKNLKITDVDIRELFSTNFLSPIEKKEIISNYIPYISLKKAKDLGLIKTQSEVDLKKKNILEPILKKNGLSWNILDLAIKWASEEDIEIKSSEFFNDAWNLNTISEWIWFINIEKDFKWFIEDVKEDIDNNWPQSLDELRQWMKISDIDNKINWISKFKEWSVLKLTKKEKDWEDIISYIKIISFSDENKKITYKSIWNWNKIVQNSRFNNIEKSFTEFLWWIEKSWFEIDINSSEEIDLKIKSWEISSSSDNYSSLTEVWLDNEIKDLNKELKEKRLEVEKRNKSEEAKDLLEKAISEKKELEKKLKKEKNIVDKTKIKEELFLKQKEISKYSDYEKDPEYREIFDEIIKKQNELDNLWTINFDKLVSNIDLLDNEWTKLITKDGRRWLFKWMIIETKVGAYEIKDIDREWWTISIFSRWAKSWIEELSFDNFYNAFKEKKANRKVKIENFEEFLKDFWSEDDWKNHEFKNWKIIAKNVSYWATQKDMEVEYFLSKKENDLMKVESIDWDKIKVRHWDKKQLWELKENDKNDKNILKKYKKNKDWKYEWEIIRLSDKVNTYTLNEFKTIIWDKKQDFKPDWKTWKKDVISDPQASHNEFKWSFMTKLFKNISISEVVSGWKMMIEGITESMKRWNDVHAAKVALALWKILPDEVQAELKAKVDWAEWEAMEKELKKLWDVETSVAMERIDKWLENKDTAEFKKEAWLLFMISKYGFLNTKKLSKYRWKWRWYEAFWWTVWDSLFLKIQAESKADWIGFTEEKLMYELLTDQCKNYEYSNIKRRWRLYKEYDWKMWGWVSDELAKWKKEADAMRSFDSRSDASINEASWWEFNNALWKYRSALERSESLDKLNEFPFIIAFSWAWYWLQEPQLNEFKNFMWEWYGWLIYTRFVWDISWMELFTDTIVELSKKFEDVDSVQYAWMYKRALEIKSAQQDWSIKERNKMNNARDFWKDFWKPLTRTMHNLNNQDKKHEKTDKLIFLDKDSDVFDRYKNKISWYVKNDWVFSNKDIMDDQFSDQWITWLWIKVFGQIGWLDQQWKFANWSAAKKAWREIVWELKNTRNKTFIWDDINSIENKKAQRKVMISTLRWVASFIADRWSQTSIINWFLEWKWDMWIILKKFWITNYFDDILEFSTDDIAWWKADNILINISDDILSWNTNIDNVFENDSNEVFDDPFEWEQNNHKKKVEEII